MSLAIGVQDGVANGSCDKLFETLVVVPMVNTFGVRANFPTGIFLGGKVVYMLTHEGTA